MTDLGAVQRRGGDGEGMTDPGAVQRREGSLPNHRVHLYSEA